MPKPKDSSTAENSTDLEGLKLWLNGKFKEHENTLEAGLDEIKERLERIEGENFEMKHLCDELARSNRELKNEVSELKDQLTLLESHTRKDNLRFYQIRDAANEDTEQKLREFITRQLKLDGEQIDFSVVHRLGAYRPGQCRCILARFVRRREQWNVKAAATNLKGTKYGISDDLPASWAAARRQAHQKFVRPARVEKKKVRWRGARLFIDDREVNIDHVSRNDSDRTLTQSSVNLGPGDDNEKQQQDPWEDDLSQASTSTNHLQDTPREQRKSTRLSRFKFGAGNKSRK